MADSHLLKADRRMLPELKSQMFDIDHTVNPPNSSVSMTGEEYHPPPPGLFSVYNPVFHQSIQQASSQSNYHQLQQQMHQSGNQTQHSTNYNAVGSHADLRSSISTDHPNYNQSILQSIRNYSLSNSFSHQLSQLNNQEYMSSINSSLDQSVNPPAPSNHSESQPGLPSLLHAQLQERMSMMNEKALMIQATNSRYDQPGSVSNLPMSQSLGSDSGVSTPISDHSIASSSDFSRSSSFNFSPRVVNPSLTQAANQAGNHSFMEMERSVSTPSTYSEMEPYSVPPFSISQSLERQYVGSTYQPRQSAAQSLKSSTSNSTASSVSGSQATSPSSKRARVPKRSKRTPLTNEQRQALEKHFTNDWYPTIETKRMLGSKIGLTVEKVHKWFDNRRMKESKMAGKKRVFDELVNQTILSQSLQFRPQLGHSLFPHQFSELKDYMEPRPDDVFGSNLSTSLPLQRHSDRMQQVIEQTFTQSISQSISQAHPSLCRQEPVSEGRWAGMSRFEAVNEMETWTRQSQHFSHPPMPHSAGSYYAPRALERSS